jgi:hypothetical protein
MQSNAIDPIVCPRGHHAVELGTRRAWCQTCRNQGLDPNFDRDEVRNLRREHTESMEATDESHA